MIGIRFQKGQGFGNQLWCYITARVVAEDNNYELGFIGADSFKGLDFLTIDLSKRADHLHHTYTEQPCVHPRNGADLRFFDPQISTIADNTLLEGVLQDEKYIQHRKDEIRQWLAVKPEFDCYDYSHDDICIINFRGTGYVHEKELFLPPRYWEHAITNMRRINPHFRFIVVTEDVDSARLFFPDFEIYHWSIGKDYAVIKNARYLILSNSSFAWFPAWLSMTLRYCIAPKYWARHNVSDGYWCTSYNLTEGWMYQDRQGLLSDYQTCKNELQVFMNNHSELYTTTSFKPSLLNSLKEEWARVITLSREFSIISTIYRITLVVALRILLILKNKLHKSKPSPIAQPSVSSQSLTPQQYTPKNNLAHRIKRIIVRHSYY